MNKIESLWSRIHKWIDKKVPEFHAYLRPGASEEQLCEFENAIGFSVPEEFRTLYRIHNGSYRAQFFDGCYFYSVDEIIYEWTRRKEDLERLCLNQNCDLDEEKEEKREIQYKWWDCYWIPFAGSPYGDSLTIDLAPGRAGHYGQVFLWYHDFGSQIVATCLMDYLEKFVTDLEKGRYDLRKLI